MSADTQLLSLVSIADEVLSASSELSAALQRGRLELELTALSGGVGGSAAGPSSSLRLLAYLPQRLAPTLRLAPTGEVCSGLTRRSAESLAAGVTADAPAPGVSQQAGLRRRRTGSIEGNVQARGINVDEDSEENEEEICDAVEPVNPLTWCGPGAPASLRSAAAAFTEAIEAASRLARARAELAKTLPLRPLLPKITDE